MNKLLCICPIGIGNYLLCYPAFDHLRKCFPDSSLHLLALRKPITDLADGDSLWDTIHLIEPTGKPDYGTILKFIRKLRSERFCASICFFPSNTWQYQLLPFLAGIPRRFVFSYRFKKIASLSFLASSHINVNPRLHDVEQNIAIAAHVTGKPFPSVSRVVFPKLFSEEDTDKAKTILLKETRYIAIHPGSSAEHGMDAKRWAPERFAKLADLVCEKLNAAAIILGGPDEQPLKAAVKNAMHYDAEIIEPLPLRLTAALMSRCPLCICNDSGLMHLAACSNVPVIALFGPTDDKRNGPYGNNHCIIRKPGSTPLWRAENVGNRKITPGCNPNSSLDELTVDEAWAQCSTYIERLLPGCQKLTD